MQLKYNFIVKDVLEIQEREVFSERSEYKEMEAEGHFSGEGTVGFHQTVQDIREHIGKCVVSLCSSHTSTHAINRL